MNDNVDGGVVQIPDGETLLPFQYSNNHTITRIILPSTIKVIPRGCFMNTPNLHSIHIPASVTRIEYKAFYDSKVNIVTFEKDSKLHTIFSNAFMNCSELENITLPNSLRVLGKNSFKNSAIHDIQFNNNTQSNESNYKDKSNVLQDSETYSPKRRKLTSETTSRLSILGSCCFQDCLQFTKFALPSLVREIQPMSFNNSSIQHITFHSQSVLQIIGMSAFSNTKKINPKCKLILPQTVNLVCQSAFAASSLTSIQFSDMDQDNHSSLSIQKNAFENMGYLKCIIFPKQLQALGKKCFAVSYFESIYFHPDCHILTIPSECFLRFRSSEVINIPSSVRMIQTKAFDSLTTAGVTFSQILTKSSQQKDDSQSISEQEKVILNNANIYSQKNAIHNSPHSRLLWIGSNAFLKMKTLDDTTSFILPPSLVGVDFKGCSGSPIREIDRISLPNLKYLLQSSFDNSLIQSLQLSDILYLGISAFNSCFQLTTVHCEDKIQDEYKQEYNQIQIHENQHYARNLSLKLIPETCFQSCTRLFTIILPHTIERIAKFAFRASMSIDSISFQGNYSHLDQSYHPILPFLTYAKDTPLNSNPNDTSNSTTYTTSFASTDYDLSHLPQIHLKQIDTTFFSPNPSKYSIVIPNSVQFIKESAFKKVPLHSLEFQPNSSLLYIGKEAFAQCGGPIAEVKFPDNLLCIENAAFEKTNINNITFGPKSKIINVGIDAFRESRVENVLIPRKKFILFQKDAFAQCPKLRITKHGLPLKDVVNIPKDVSENGSLSPTTKDITTTDTKDNNNTEVFLSLPTLSSPLSILDHPFSSFKPNNPSIFDIYYDMWIVLRNYHILQEMHSLLTPLTPSEFEKSLDLLLKCWNLDTRKFQCQSEAKFEDTTINRNEEGVDMSSAQIDPGREKRDLEIEIIKRMYLPTPDREKLTSMIDVLEEYKCAIQTILLEYYSHQRDTLSTKMSFPTSLQSPTIFANNLFPQNLITFSQITIPNTVTVMTNNYLALSHRLSTKLPTPTKRVLFEQGSTLRSIENFAFCDYLTDETLSLPASVEILEKAFKSCTIPRLDFEQGSKFSYYTHDAFWAKITHLDLRNARSVTVYNADMAQIQNLYLSSIFEMVILNGNYNSVYIDSYPLLQPANPSGADTETVNLAAMNDNIAQKMTSIRNIPISDKNKIQLKYLSFTSSMVKQILTVPPSVFLFDLHCYSLSPSLPSLHLTFDTINSRSKISMIRSAGYKRQKCDPITLPASIHNIEGNIFHENTIINYASSPASVATSTSANQPSINTFIDTFHSSVFDIDLNVAAARMSYQQIRSKLLNSDFSCSEDVIRDKSRRSISKNAGDLISLFTAILDNIYLPHYLQLPEQYKTPNCLENRPHIDKINSNRYNSDRKYVKVAS